MLVSMCSRLVIPRTYERRTSESRCSESRTSAPGCRMDHMEDQQLISACVEKWDFNWLLHRATQRVGAAFADEITKFGITLRGQLILQALANEELQRTQLKLGAMLGLDKTTLTSELDKLERLGLITRVPDPKDRRVRTPVITDEGLELQKQAGAALAE